MENFLRWIEKVLEFINKYGIINILKSCMIIIIFSITVSFVMNPGKLVNVIMEAITRFNLTIEDESGKLRTYINPAVNSLLDQSILDLDCARAFVLEGHNGKSNHDGLGFYYVDMMYERSRDLTKFPSVYWEYVNMPISIFPIFNYLKENYYFYGSIDDLEKIDTHLAHKISDSNTKFLVLIEIPSRYSNKQAIGVLGYSFESSPKQSQKEIEDYALEIRFKIHKLLTATSEKEIKQIKNL